jgi:tetratricopeptide (TPR) repeat protein
MYAQSGVAIAHLMAGRWRDAHAALDEAARSGTDRADSGTVSFSRAVAAWVALEQRDWQRAQDLAAVAAELAPTVYFRGYAYAFGFNPVALARAAQLDQALAMLEQVAPAIRASGHELGWMCAAWRLAVAYMEAGRAADARRVLDDLLDAGLRSRAPFFVGAAQRALADLALADGEPAAAVQLLLPSIETLRAHGCENELGVALGSLACAERRLGDERGARAHVREAVEILERLGTLHEPDRLRGELRDPATPSAGSSLAGDV